MAGIGRLGGAALSKRSRGRRRPPPGRRSQALREATRSLRPSRRTLVFWLTAALLVAATVIGGASRDNPLQLMTLELLSLPVLGAALWRLAPSRFAGARAPLLLLAAAAVLGLAQLIPLPFETWASLPGREDLAAALRRTGAAPDALALSLVPDATWRALLALLIPGAVLVGALACSHAERKALAVIVVLLAATSLLIGIAQQMGGADSPLRFYRSTFAEEAVGLFANHNHQALFLACSIPLAALWARDLIVSGRKGLLLTAAAALGLLGVVLVGVAASQSRAGLLLLGPAVGGAALVIWRSLRKDAVRSRHLGVGAAALVAIAALVLVIGQNTVQSFSPNIRGEARLQLWPTALEAAEKFSPLGSGLGSFDPVYRSLESVDTIERRFVNQAHNDYIELWLEAGWPGLLLLAIFAVWIGYRGWSAWLHTGQGASMARAASVVILLVGLHSIVDYPVRTPAVASLLALSCGFLAAFHRSRKVTGV